MRREILICSAGVVAGFALATLIFWQPPATPESGPARNASTRDVAESPGPPAPVRSAEPARIGLPVAVEADRPVIPPEPRTPSGLLHAALSELPGMDEGMRDKAVADLVAGLRKQGAAGIQAVRAFFATGSDVTLRNGWGMMNGRITSAPSLRIALLEALADWPGGLEANREIARTTSRPFEAAIAIRNLEKAAPGVYRTEAIRTMQELADQPNRGEYAMEGANYVIEAMRHFEAPELIPAAEKVVKAQPHAAYALVNALVDMPDNVAGPALDRIFADQEAASQFAANPHVLRNLPFSQPRVVGQVAKLFGSGMTAKQQDRFLSDFGAGRAYSMRSDFFATESAESQKPGIAISEIRRDAADIQGRLAFLDQIKPVATTPVLEQRVNEARDELTKALEEPKETGAAANVEQVIMIGNGAGDAVIKGRKIQNIQIRIDK